MTIVLLLKESIIAKISTQYLHILIYIYIFLKFWGGHCLPSQTMPPSLAILFIFMGHINGCPWDNSFFFFFLREFQSIVFASDDNSLLSDQNTNQFLV